MLYWDNVETVDTGEYVPKAANATTGNQPEDSEHCDIYADRHGRSGMTLSL
jgi:hypothetical protein